MHKIVVLDEYTTVLKDLSWEKLEIYGEVVKYKRTAPSEVVERCKDADIILLNKVVINEETMNQLPRLRYIGVLATGYNIVDIAAARKRGIVVANVPAYSTMSVAQMVFAHLLNVTHHVSDYAASVRAGKWQSCDDFCYVDSPLIELDGKTIGIIGLGNIGIAVARIAQTFGMKVLAYSSKSADVLEPLGIERAESYDEVFERADVLSLHCPLTADTKHLVNVARLALMKPDAILINTGRGPLVDEQALADALNEGRIAAACADVLTQEPPRSGSPLITARNCYLTPHIAWASDAARKRLVDVTVDNVKNFVEGHPINNVVGK